MLSTKLRAHPVGPDHSLLLGGSRMVLKSHQVLINPKVQNAMSIKQHFDDFLSGVTSGDGSSTLGITLSDSNSGSKYQCRATSGTLIGSSEVIFVFTDFDPTGMSMPSHG